MANKYFAEDMAEATAIILWLESNDNFSGEVSRHNLIVSWRDAELDWEEICYMAEGIREMNAIVDSHYE